MLCSKWKIIALGSLHVYGVYNAGEPDHVTGSPALHPVIRHPHEKCMRCSSLVPPPTPPPPPRLKSLILLLSVFLVELPVRTQLAAAAAAVASDAFVATLASRSSEAARN